MPTVLLAKTTVDFLRHGEVKGGTRFRGITDDPLTEQGWRQMFQQCRDQQWQIVVSSPMHRCASFASAWGREQRTEVIVEDGWKEIDFGDWEGLSADEIGVQQADALSRYYTNPMEFTPPNAESYSDFAGRIQQTWENLLARHAGQNVLVVTHAGVIRVLFSMLLGIPPKQSFQIEVPHACMTRFSCYDDAEGRFVQLNFHRPV